MDYSVDKKLIVFESDPDFSDNSRGLWEYVVKNTDYKTFWVIKDEVMKKRLEEKGVCCDLAGSERSNRMIAQARFLVSSSFYFAYEKRTDQIHISAWHGFPLKLIGFFDNAAVNKNSFESLKIITTQSDIITATSRLAQLVISGLFAVDPRKVKETGYPRNDIMFQTNAVEALKKITDVAVSDSKMVFYLPTMRKGLKKEGEQFENNIFNYKDYSAELLDEFLEKNNAYIFTKVHFADNKFFPKNDFKLPKRLIFLDTELLNEQFLTIYHIMNAFDALITDYSSVYVDYLLLDKPIIFSCPDLEKYQSDRGFIIDDPKLLMPGPIIKTQKELTEQLEKVFSGNDVYKEERKKKIDFFHFYKDSNSAERLFGEMMKMDRVGGEDSAKELGNQFYDQNSPLAQYADKLTAEIFYDMGDGFNEECKQVIDYQIGRKDYSEILIDDNIPSGTRNIRFDPDYLGKCILRNFSVWIDERQVSYEVIGGCEQNKTIIFETQDPQILIALNGVSGHHLRIKYEGIDLYANAGKNLVDMQRENSSLREELSSIYRSNSWKLTEPLRKIGRKIKKMR